MSLSSLKQLHNPISPPSFVFAGSHRSNWDCAALSDLRPTQMAVGMRSVEAKRQKIERHFQRKRKMRRFLEKRPIPVVVGPEDDYYMIDHHHLCLALWHHDVEEVFVRVVSDLSGMPQRQFLQSMSAFGWLHSFDSHGQPVCPTKLPPSIKKLRSDPFRDLAWSVRRAGGFRKLGIPFMEFAWAGFFRQNIPEAIVRNDFDKAHNRAFKLARSEAARALPGFVSRN